MCKIFWNSQNLFHTSSYFFLTTTLLWCYFVIPILQIRKSFLQHSWVDKSVYVWLELRFLTANSMLMFLAWWPIQVVWDLIILQVHTSYHLVVSSVWLWMWTTFFFFFFVDPRHFFLIDGCSAVNCNFGVLVEKRWAQSPPTLPSCLRLSAQDHFWKPKGTLQM